MGGRSTKQSWTERGARVLEVAQDYENGWIRTGEVTPFGEQITAEFTPLIELDSSNGLSLELRDTVVETGSGTVTNANGEHVLSTGATASSTATLETKERGRYQPGIVGIPGLGFRLDAIPTGDMDAFGGYYDDVDGVWIGQDATGIYIQYRHNGTTEPKVYQKDWNGRDPLNGNGPSGVTLDMTQANVFRFPFVWYFAGPLIVRCQTMAADGTPIYAELHRVTGMRDSPIFSNPKLPINADVKNGGTAADMKMYVGGRHFAVVGRYNPNRRTTPEYRSGITVAGGATEPLISFQKKSDRQSFSKSVKLAAASIQADQNGLLKIYLNATLTGADFTAVTEVPTTETAMESDITATGITGGYLIESTVTSTQSRNKSDSISVGDLAVDIPSGTIVTLAFENTTANSATVSGSFACKEEW